MGAFFSGPSYKYKVDVDGNGKLVLARGHIKLLKKYAPNFTATRAPTPKDEELMTRSWEVVIGAKLRAELERRKFQVNTDPDAPPESSAVVQFYDVFFTNLYTIDPATRPVFRNSMHVQSKALVNIVGAIRHILHSADATNNIAALALRHIQYGVKLEFFDSLGLAMIETLRSLGGSFWSDDVGDAWRTVIAYIICLLVPPYMEGARSKEHKHLTMATSRSRGSASRVAVGDAHPSFMASIARPSTTEIVG
ncbi:hypothetical protein SPRG_14152 [Saprolegnia parasitica CBS 223.65]|uniref:Globin domain-containing protein n=1 Tax=Saprolegnia parasitica (strain CBS 223.65) TaxID=695850 RepID=A0A067C2Y8_SAPPC|nr:hypothetical protein SPRG_14152 [Saprolegnia parasitica CBS 223.65]KDO20921.1 hypothetical protein SPRG_14152 [Saprolegnia parasitica CBS 223.65]|eukprot:XP_012208408.1 hypothetical protein SPRG_14152 [Saprolegnia parasitica CBS 223.65]